MKGPLTVVPNGKSESKVNDDAAENFQLGNEKGAKKGLEEKRGIGERKVDRVDGTKANAAQNGHGKVAVPTKKNFNHGIKDKTEGKTEQKRKKIAFHTASKRVFGSIFCEKWRCMRVFSWIFLLF